MREGPGRGKGTSPPPVADEGLVPFPQRSKNRRNRVSPNGFSPHRKADRKRNLSTLPHLPFPGLLPNGPPMARLRKLRPCFSCHRQRKAAIPLPGVVFFGTFLLDKQKKGTPSSQREILRRLRLLRMTGPEAYPPDPRELGPPPFRQGGHNGPGARSFDSLRSRSHDRTGKRRDLGIAPYAAARGDSLRHGARDAKIVL